MVNTLLLSRPTGSQTRIADQAARGAYGPYEQSLELFTTTDAAMIDRGNWIISRYADPPPELRTVPLDTSQPGLTTYRAVLAAAMRPEASRVGQAGVSTVESRWSQKLKKK